MPKTLLRNSLLVGLSLGAIVQARAQTDEIQVYDATIDPPGQFSLELHHNYTPIGRAQPDFPGGIVPNHALNGVAEWAYGVTDRFELGLYLPLYTLSGGQLQFNGGKLRALFVVPNAKEQSFFYGINFELSFNAHQWEQTHKSGEVRPILGEHLGPWDLIFNPIIDTGFNGLRKLDFAPAARVAYNFSPRWAGAVEHYADFGYLSDLAPLRQEAQTTFLVVDYNGDPNSIEFGIGHGFTEASDGLLLKLMITHEF
jgi:hypothetical protein